MLTTTCEVTAGELLRDSRCEHPCTDRGAVLGLQAGAGRGVSRLPLGRVTTVNAFLKCLCLDYPNVVNVLILLVSLAQLWGNSQHLCRQAKHSVPSLSLSSHQDTNIASPLGREIIVIVGLWALTSPDDDIAKQMFSLR